jgi:hypothetical protein
MVDSPMGQPEVPGVERNAINVALYEKLSFDFVRDIAPVGRVESVPLVMEVHPSVPAKTVPD